MNTACCTKSGNPAAGQDLPLVSQKASHTAIQPYSYTACAVRRKHNYFTQEKLDVRRQLL
jgi:hypothetical protein